MIYLMRHGETEHRDGFYGRTDSQLTPQGMAQMLTQAHTLNITAIVTSPLQRCRMVAEQLATQLSCPLYQESLWQEYDFGDWEGQSIAQLWERYPTELAQLWQNPTLFTPPNAEPFSDFMTRVRSARDSLTEKYAQYGHLLVLTHAGVIRTLRLLSQQNQFDNWLTYPVPHASLHYLSHTTHQLIPLTNAKETNHDG